jgi:3alpha(or 20beta)-hydroxysteroid dehydrogenase
MLAGARPGESDELARMLLFMVADATFSTGSEFIADGGSVL